MSKDQGSAERREPMTEPTPDHRSRGDYVRHGKPSLTDGDQDRQSPSAARVAASNIFAMARTAAATLASQSSSATPSSGAKTASAKSTPAKPAGMAKSASKATPSTSGGTPRTPPTQKTKAPDPAKSDRGQRTRTGPAQEASPDGSGWENSRPVKAYAAATSKGRNAMDSSKAGAVDLGKLGGAAAADRGVEGLRKVLKSKRPTLDENGQEVASARDKAVDAVVDTGKDVATLAAAAAAGQYKTAVVTAVRSKNIRRGILLGALASALLILFPTLIMASALMSVLTNQDQNPVNRTVAVRTVTEDLPTDDGAMAWRDFETIGDLSSSNPFVLAAINKQGLEAGRPGSGPMTLDAEHPEVTKAVEEGELTEDQLEDGQASARWLSDHLRESMQEHLDRPQYDLGWGYQDTNDFEIRDVIDGDLHETRRQENAEAWAEVVKDLPIAEAEARAPEIVRIAIDWTIGKAYQRNLGVGGMCSLSGGSGEGVAIPPEYVETLNQASAAAGLPVNVLAAQIQAESNWDPNARSPVGAQGLTQFMPATWAAFGEGSPFDPIAAITAQGKYMGHLKGLVENSGMAGGDSAQVVRLTLASYNAGFGNVTKHGGVPPFPETQGYLTKILGMAGDDFEMTCTGLSANGVGVDDYPHRAPIGVEGWSYPRSVFGHTQRQCTDFVMWRINQAMGWSPGSGTAPPFTMRSLGIPFPPGAGDWKDYLPRNPGVTFHSEPPAPGDVAWWGYNDIGGGWGHVGWVAAVDEATGTVTVENYNYPNANAYGVTTHHYTEIPGYLRISM